MVVGPSGSGKSTLLEIICGFKEPTKGTIEVDGKVINNLLPKDRDVAMVFQNYALYPHLNIYDNIALGMKIRKVKKDIIDEKVKWAAKILEIDEELDKKPKNLSGGQRQRVALARAMVRNPKVFLMDEPLSNLDAKLRYQTSNEIVNLHRSLNATTIYVTHDQREALTMGDRIIVLNEGRIEQIGSPREVYNNPKNIFVSRFIGNPQINLFSFVIQNNEAIFDCGIKLTSDTLFNGLSENKKYILGIRPEDISYTNSEDIRSRIKKVEFLGGESIIYLEFNGVEFLSKTYNVIENKVGDYIGISFNLRNANIFDYNTKENMRRDK